MSHAPADATLTTNLLGTRIAHLIQPIQERLGSWNVYSTGEGAILAVSRCGLGDAGFLPQALHHGGLHLHRVGASRLQASGVPHGAITVGEIRWPAHGEDNAAVPGTPPDSPLSPNAARPQVFSILLQAVVPSAHLASKRFAKNIQPSLAEIQKVLGCKWWQGLASGEQKAKDVSALNLHLSTKDGEQLTPYEFERRVMPILTQAAALAQQDGLLIRFDNPSTNWFVYCAAQHRVLALGLPCPAGHPHPS